MPNSLLTGISGLRSHQQMLEVVGNNLANINTTGYKSERALFSDLMYQTLQSGSSSNTGIVGSTNPVQIGTGVHLSSVDRSTAQGNLSATGESLDLALDGDGFFVVSNGSENVFTRAGAFAISDNGYLVDPATGYQVQRFGTVGELDGTSVSFQSPGDNGIKIPIGAMIPGDATTQINVSGNLSASATGPVAHQLRNASPFLVSGLPATSSSLLNSLDGNTTPYGMGDSILISGVAVDGSQIASSVPVDGTSTLGDLLSAINASFPGSTASLDTMGNISITANSDGPASLNVSIADAPGNAGETEFSTHSFLVSAAGKNADTVRGGVEVFDARGTSHTVGLLFTKQSDGTWNMDASLDPGEGVLLDGQVTGLQFQPDGSFAQILGTGNGDGAMRVQFTGDANAETIQLNFGTAGAFDRLSATGSPSALSVDSNGYPPGTLHAVNIDSNGTVYGLATNGEEIKLADLAVATFRNPGGLSSSGNNYFSTSLASGTAEYGSALSGGRGAIQSNHLEQSNVDLALEFTNLIIAQRGFSANARTITVTDQILQELTGLVR